MQDSLSAALAGEAGMTREGCPGDLLYKRSHEPYVNFIE